MTDPDFSLDAMVALSLQMEWGSAYVMAAHLKETFLNSLRTAAGARTIDVLDVDDRDWREVQKKIVEGAEKGAVVLLVGMREFPSRLAHIAYVFNKDDGLVMPDGGTRRNYGLPGFRLILWMTPQAWESIDPDLRDRLIRATLPPIHCYLESPHEHQSVAILEERRREAARDPVKALKTANSLDERHRLFLELFPPDHQEGTFTPYDEAMTELMQTLTDDGDADLQGDLIEIFALHDDFYLAGKALRSGWSCREQTLERLAAGMEATQSIGGQRQYFWDLMKILVERGQPRIRRLMENLLLGESLGAENVLYVLTEVRPWPDIVDRTRRLAETNKDLGVQDLCRQVLREAYRCGVAQDQRHGHDGGSLAQPMIPTRVCGMPVDDYQYYVEVGTRSLGGNCEANLKNELKRLARFQAAIQDLPVGAYPKSIRTFQRAFSDLADRGSWVRSVELNHLASVSDYSSEYRLMRSTMEHIV
jgi:hypothetical protein